MYIFSPRQISRYFTQQVETTILQMAILRHRAVQYFAPGLFSRALVHVATEHDPGHSSSACLQTSEWRVTSPPRFAKGRSLSCLPSKPAQLLPALKPRLFSYFLLLRVACAKLGSIRTWELHTWVLVFWGCGFSLRIWMLIGAWHYSGPKPHQVFFREWLNTVDNRDFFLTKV